MSPFFRGIKILPTSFLVDTKDNICYRVLGNLDWDNNSTIDIIEQLISDI